MTKDILSCEFAAGRFDKVYRGLYAYIAELDEAFSKITDKDQVRYAKEMLYILNKLLEIKLAVDDTECDIDDKAESIRNGVVKITRAYLYNPILADHKSIILNALHNFFLFITRGNLMIKTGIQYGIAKGFTLFSQVSAPAKDTVKPEDARRMFHYSI